jgi:hypothetical protein
MKSLLREKNISPFAQWEKELPKLAFDPRFTVLPLVERKIVFESFVKNRLEEQRLEKRAALKAKQDAFHQLLDEELAKGTIQPLISFEEAKRILRNDPRALGLDIKEREAIFKEKMAPLRKAAEESLLSFFFYFIKDCFLDHNVHSYRFFFKEQAALCNEFIQLLRENLDIIQDNAFRWAKVRFFFFFSI